MYRDLTKRCDAGLYVDSMLCHQDLGQAVIIYHHSIIYLYVTLKMKSTQDWYVCSTQISCVQYYYYDVHPCIRFSDCGPKLEYPITLVQ